MIPAKNYAAIFLVPFFFGALFSSLYSNPVLKLKNGIELYDLAPYLSFYKDPGRKLQIEDIIKQDKRKDFFDRNGNSPNFGITGASIWGKFQWQSESSKKNEWLLIFESERLEEINVYIVLENKIISAYHYDYRQLFSDRLIPHRKLIFPLPKQGELQTIYFNAKTSDVLELTSEVATPMALSSKNNTDSWISGLYYGIMFSMFLYNIFIFFFTHDKTYFYYITYIISFVITQSGLDGLLHQYFFPESFEFARNLIIYAACISLAFGLLFAVSVLQINYYPRLLYFYMGLISICILPAITLPVYGYHNATLFLGYFLIFICIFQIVVSFILSFKIKLARYYFIAWLIFLIGLVIEGLKDFNIYIPFLSSHNYAIQFGSAAEAILLSLALGYRINVMRRSIMEKDNELLNAKFTNLRDKMNPHFVLNTLSIIMSYLKRDVNKANAALNYFTSSYKYLIRHENEHLTPLEDELTFTKDYTSILLIKYSDTLKVDYNISGDIKKIQIPFLSLQPIVENAFKHGIRKLANGEIKIKIYVSGQKVDIEVRNTSNGSAIKKPFQGTLGAIKRRIEYFFEDAEFSMTDYHNETIVKIHYVNIIKEGNLLTTDKQFFSSEGAGKQIR